MSVNLKSRLEEINSRAQTLNSSGADLSKTDIQSSQPSRKEPFSSIEAKLQTLNILQDFEKKPDTQIPQRNLIANSIPSKGPWAVALFDMGRGSLTVTRYENGRRSKSITILTSPGSRGVFSGADNRFSGEIDFRNESEYATFRNRGPIPLGSYDIRTMKEREITKGSKDYNRNYPTTKRKWLVLDAQDGKPGNDVNDVYDRDGLRLHLGNGSAGCVTIPAEKAAEWKRIEEIIPDGKINGQEVPGKILGQMTVIDTSKGTGNAMNHYAGSQEQQR